MLFNLRNAFPQLTKSQRGHHHWCISALLTAMLAAASCTPKNQALIEVPPRENHHLRFEADPLQNFALYQGFVVRYDTLHKVPRYTIHRLSPTQLADSTGNPTKRSNVYFIDPRLRNISATKSDYYRSGFDRGHHAPAGDFVYSQALKDESFVYSNISPQNPELNRGVFASLEKQIRLKVSKCDCDAYVITGSYFESESKSIGQGSVGVPSALYKVAYLPSINRVYAYWFPNETPPAPVTIRSYQLTLDELESKTGLDFLERLPEALEEKLEARKRTL